MDSSMFVEKSSALFFVFCFLLKFINFSITSNELRSFNERIR